MSVRKTKSFGSFYMMFLYDVLVYVLCIGPGWILGENMYKLVLIWVYRHVMLIVCRASIGLLLETKIKEVVITITI